MSRLDRSVASQSELIAVRRRAVAHPFSHLCDAYEGNRDSVSNLQIHRVGWADENVELLLIFIRIEPISVLSEDYPWNDHNSFVTTNGRANILPLNIADSCTKEKVL